MTGSLPNVAPLLHQARLQLHWSREELARRAGVAVDAIAAYESEPAALSVPIAVRVYEALPLDYQDALFAVPATSRPSSPPGWPTPEMEARVEEIGAAFAIDKRDLAEALDCLHRALSFGPREELVGQLLFSKAAVFAELGHEEPALEILAQAQCRVDAGAAPRLWLRMRLEQLHLLCQVQRFDEAAALTKETLDLAAHVGKDRDRLEAHCLAGRIAAGSGRAEALPLLQEARARLLATGRTLEATAVALDLAALSIENRDLAALAPLARDLEALCRRKKLASSVRSRLKVFCWSVRGNHPDAERTRALARELRRVVGRVRRPYELPVSV